MKKHILPFGALAIILALVGCMRGQSAESKLDPNQVRAIPGANDTTENHLVLPIKGKPYDSATQWIFDRIVAAQAGGDIKSISVDPSTVKVTFSQQIYGEGLFIVIGKAHVVLTEGAEFDAYFREPIIGGCQEDRIFTAMAPITCRIPRLIGWDLRAGRRQRMGRSRATRRKRSKLSFQSFFL
jgi:hypothetical protein